MREEAPYTDSIRRDQIKLLASSAPEADRLTVCPIWVSGTVMVRGLGGLEVTATSCTSTPGDYWRQQWQQLSEISSSHIQQILFNMDVFFAAELCATIWHENVNWDIRRKSGVLASDPKTLWPQGPRTPPKQQSPSKHKVSIWLPCTSMQSITGHGVHAEACLCVHTGPKSKQVTSKDSAIMQSEIRRWKHNAKQLYYFMNTVL